MSRIEILLTLFVVACLVFCSLTWLDNRGLRMELATRECVSPRSHRVLLQTCEIISHVNQKQEAFIQRAEKAIGVRYDQIRSATRDSGSRKDKGLGGGP